MPMEKSSPLLTPREKSVSGMKKNGNKKIVAKKI